MISQSGCEFEMPILTLTLNPALDLATGVDRLIEQHKMRCDPPRFDPGGGGINVARVIGRLGGAATALYLAGGPIGGTLKQLLDQEQVHQDVLPISGTTRISFAVRDRTEGRQYRFVLPGPLLTDAEWRLCLDHLTQMVAGFDFVVASGSLPPGAPRDAYAQMARLARARNIRFVLDSSGPALAAGLEPGVFLAKPSLQELVVLAGRDLPRLTDQQAFAADLVARGVAEVVVVSLGAGGAILAAKDVCRHAAAPAVDVKSTVGAGDSFVGGMVLGLERGWPLSEAFNFGLAAAGATLLMPGTELCRRDDAERLHAQLTGA
jgi:6-phosphofructokinase 2